MYCKNCGNNVADGLAYCDICGAELNAEPNADVTSYEESIVESVPAVDPGKTLGIVSWLWVLLVSLAAIPWDLSV